MARNRYNSRLQEQLALPFAQSFHLPGARFWGVMAKDIPAEPDWQGLSTWYLCWGKIFWKMCFDLTPHTYFRWAFPQISRQNFWDPWILAIHSNLPRILACLKCSQTWSVMSWENVWCHPPKEISLRCASQHCVALFEDWHYGHASTSSYDYPLHLELLPDTWYTLDIFNVF